MGWRDLVGMRVGVWGLGVEGKANLNRALELGIDVVVVDDAMVGSQIGSHQVVTGNRLFDCDAVVKTPGISRYSSLAVELESAGVAVLGGIGLWLWDTDRSRVSAVTGTKGKSTTTAIVGQLFNGLGLGGAIGGNIGVLPYDYDRPDPNFWCIELSSYQVLDLPIRPKVTALTSLSPDHLEWHGDVETYYKDKLSIVALDGDGPILAASQGGDLAKYVSGLEQLPTMVEVDDRAASLAAELGLRGAHNQANTALAVAVVEALSERSFSERELLGAAAGFDQVIERVLSSRLTTVDVVNGIEFVDDCLSTNILPTISGLEVFAARPTAVITGGFDRGIDYSELGSYLANDRPGQELGPLLVLCLDEPHNGPAIAQAVLTAGPAPRVQVEIVGSLDQAVSRGFAWCGSHGTGVVLLSPAAPTRGQSKEADKVATPYHSYKAKSEHFTKLVAALSRD